MPVFCWHSSRGKQCRKKKCVKNVSAIGIGRREGDATNVIKVIFLEGTPGKKEREEAGNGLLLFPVSGLRIPKISDFCEKRNENAQTRFAQTVCIFVSLFAKFKNFRASYIPKREKAPGLTTPPALPLLPPRRTS